jgi:hypothetical protein
MMRRIAIALIGLLGACALTTASAQIIFAFSTSQHWQLIGQDQFQRANSALTTPWVVTGGAPQIVSDTVEVGATSTGTHAYLAGTYPNNQYAQITVAVQNTSACGSGAIVRLTGASPTETFYQFGTAGGVGAGSTFTLLKVVSGTLSVLNSWTGTLALGDTLAIEVIGTTINVYHNGTLLGAVTDSSVTTGNPGITVYVPGGGATTDCALDNFAGGAVTVSGSAPAPPVVGLPFPRIGVQAISGGQLMPAANDNALARYEMVIIGGNFNNWSSTAGRTRDAVVTSLKGQTHTGKNAVTPIVLQYQDFAEVNPSAPWDPEFLTVVTSNNWFLYNSGSSGTKTPSSYSGSFNVVDMDHAVGTDSGSGLWPWQWVANDFYCIFITGSCTNQGSGMASSHLDGAYIDVTSIKALTGGCGDWLRTGTCQADTNATAVAGTQTGKQDMISYWRTLTGTSYSIAINNNAAHDCSATGQGGAGITCAGLATIGTPDYGMQQFMWSSSASESTCPSPLNFGSWTLAMGWYQNETASLKSGGLPQLTGCLVATDYQTLRYSLGFCMVGGNAVCFYGLGGNDVVDDDTGEATCTSGGCFPVFDEFWGGSRSLAGYCGNALATTQGAVQTAAWQNGVWRRDFQNCTIVVNPTGNGTQTITLGGTFWFLSGTQAPTVNTGASTTGFSLAAGDGRVLLTSAP